MTASPDAIDGGQLHLVDTLVGIQLQWPRLRRFYLHPTWSMNVLYNTCASTCLSSACHTQHMCSCPPTGGGLLCTNAACERAASCAALNLKLCTAHLIHTPYSAAYNRLYVHIQYCIPGCTSTPPLSSNLLACWLGKRHCQMLKTSKQRRG
jgi:hypothetical protein